MTNRQGPLAAGSRAELQRLIWSECRSSGLRQYEIAEKAGITPKHMTQIMRGQVVPSLEVVDRILAVLGRQLVFSTRIAVEAP